MNHMAQYWARSVWAALLAAAVILGTSVPLIGAEAATRSTTSAIRTMPGTWRAEVSGTRLSIYG